MSYVLRVTRGKDVNLGPSLEFLKFVSDLRRQAVQMDVEAKFAHIKGLVGLNEEPQTYAQLEVLSSEASLAQVLFRFDEHGRWILSQLEDLT